MHAISEERAGERSATGKPWGQFRRLLVLALIGVAAGVAMGQTLPGRPAVVEAEGFVLRDSRGRTRAQLSLLADGSVVLVLANQSGESRMALVVGVDGAPQLSLRDADGKSRVMIGMLPGGMGIRLQDATGKVIWSTP